MSNPDQDPVKRSGATSRGVREGVGDGVVAAPSADGDRGRLMLDRFMPYRLAALAETVSEALGDIYRERFDLSRQQWRVLATLAETTDLPAREVGARAQLDKMQVSRAVATLTARGVIAGRIDATDRRNRLLRLTPAGRALYRRIVPLALAREAEILAVLTPGERAALDRVLAKLAAGTAR